MNYGWRFMTLYRRQGSRPSIPKKKKCKKAKWLSEEALQIAEKRREAKGKGEKERYTHLNAEFQRIARRHKKAFLSNQGKEIEENNRMGKTRDLFKKIRDTKGTFHAKLGSIKDRNDRDLPEAEDKKRWQEYTELYKGHFPGGPVAETPSSQCRGPGYDPWSGNQIPHAAAKRSKVP